MKRISQIWPDWQVVDILGEGHYGKVYKAERYYYGNTFYSAIKQIDIPKNLQDINKLKVSGMTEVSIKRYYDAQIKDVVNEIKTMEWLKSAKNIVGIEDYKIVNHEDGIKRSIYIRMELLESLTHYLSRHTFTMKDVLKLAIDICTALEYCGQFNLIHRDIKYDNIFINEFGDFILGDFGIAKRMDNVNNIGTFAGTHSYMAPEVYKRGKYDARVDIYSLGIVLYKLMNRGRLPFVNENPTPDSIQKAISRRISGERLPFPQDAHNRLGQIILKACAYSPNDRFLSAREMKNALLNIEKNNVINGKDVIIKQFVQKSFVKKGGILRINYQGQPYSFNIAKKSLYEGYRIVVPQKGQKGLNGGKNGDLYIEIHILR